MGDLVLGVPKSSRFDIRLDRVCFPEERCQHRIGRGGN